MRNEFMRRRIAYLFYIVGSLIAIGWVAGAGVLGLIGAIPVWWIAVGFGVRVGVTPDDFASSVKHLLGFDVEYDVPQEGSPEPPGQRPTI